MRHKHTDISCVRLAVHTVVIQHIRTFSAGNLKGGFFLPFCNGIVCACQQNSGNGSVVPYLRTGILRMLKQAVIMALYAVGIAVGKHSVLKSCYRIGQYKRRKLAAGQNVISYRNLLRIQLIKHSLVNAFIMSAKYYKAVLCGKLFYNILRQHSALRRHIYHTGRSIRLLLYCGYAVIYRLCLHNHTRAASVCLVIDTVVLVSGIVTDIVTMYIYMTCFSSSADYAFRQVRFAHIGKEGSYINPYHRFSVYSSSNKPSSGLITR